MWQPRSTHLLFETHLNLIKKIYSRRPYCGSDSACLNSQDARQMGQCCSAWLDSHLAMHGIMTC